MKHAVRGTKAAACLVALTLASGSSATAAASEGRSEAPTITRISAQQIEESTVPAERASGVGAERVESYLERQARAGSPVDVAELSYVEVRVPNADATVAAVHPETERLSQVDTFAADPAADQRIRAAMWAFEPVSADAAPSSVEGGPGYDEAGSQPGWPRRSGGQGSCRDLWFDAVYSGDDHFIYDCWEKFQQGTSNDWAYNRYTLFDQAAPDEPLEKGRTLDATIRSRPWADESDRITGGPYQYQPTPSSACEPQTVGITVRGFSLNIPLFERCTNIEALPVGASRSMGADWDGDTASQVYLDSAWHFTSNGEVPFYADYVWMEVQSCQGVGTGCNPWDDSEYESWQDTGW